MPLSRLSSAVSRVHRTVAVTSTAVRVYRGYKRTQRRVQEQPEAERAAAWERRHRESAEQIVATARRLRGLYVKAAQYLGARADLLPEQYIAALSQLHDRVPPQPYGVIRAVLRAELGDEPERVFARFERAPVAAASLAQVHRAVLRDGRRVAVKVQYPDIERLVRLDLRNLSTILRLVHRVEKSIDLEPIAEAVGKLVPQELDFVNEGRQGEAIAAGLAHRGDVCSPAVVWEHTRRRVLVTEYLDGTSVSDNEGLRRLGLDPRRVAERVVDVWGEQVLDLRHFHGDPHPGNILVLADGKLALIDFGLTARLTPETRDGVAALCRAAAHHDPAGMIAAFARLGYVAPDGSPAAYMGLAGRLMRPRRAHDAEVGQVNLRLARALRGFDISTVPAEALLVMRVLGLLTGLSARLGCPGPSLPGWLPYAGEAVAAAGD